LHSNVPGGDPLQNHVLADALDAGLAVADGVTRAAVEQPVVAAARPRGHLTALDERHAKPTERKVVREASARGASTHDQYVRVVLDGHSSPVTSKARARPPDSHPDPDEEIGDPEHEQPKSGRAQDSEGHRTQRDRDQQRRDRQGDAGKKPKCQSHCESPPSTA
jgi:hypothetical protein